MSSDTSITRSPATLLPPGASTSSQPSTPEPATLSQPTAESSTFTGLRRRRQPQGDIETGDLRGGDGSIGVSTAVAPQLRWRQVPYGSEKHHPLTTTVTVSGYQVKNHLSAGGPPGEMPLAPKFPSLEVDRFDFSVPAGRDAQLKTAASLLETPALDRWLGAEATAAPVADGPSGSAGAALLKMAGDATRTATGVAVAAVQSVGLWARATPTLSDMAPAEARAAAASGAPRLDTRVNEQKALIALAGAQYAARGIEVEVDKSVLCLQAAAEDKGPALRDFVDGFKPLLHALHGLPGEASGPQRDAARQAVDAHRALLPALDLPGDVAPLLGQVLDKLDHALASGAQALHRHADARRELNALQDQRMGAVIEQGAALSPELGQVLGSVADRLRARPAKEDQLPRDTALENIFSASVVAFGQRGETGRLALDGPQGQQAAPALQTLGTLDVRRLADAAASPESRSSAESAAVALAREVAVLPRGIEMLSALMAPPEPGAPKVDKEAVARRDAALRVLFSADATLDASGAPNATPGIPAQARTAAAAVLQTSDFKLDGLDADLRRAFNAVRNAFFDEGPGSSLQKADDYLKGLTTDMLSSVSRENGVMGALARALPIGGATALNPSAVGSATRTLAQAGLITGTQEAVDAMRTAIDTLRDNDTALPAERALKTLARALDAAVPDGAPERIVNAAIAEVQVPERFGLDERTLAQHPALSGTWERYAAGQVTPAEATHQLARIAATDLTEAKEPDAAKAVGAFRKTLDRAVGSAIWNRGQIDDKQQLLDGLISIGRLMSLRDKFKFSGGNSYGFDTSKVQLGLSQAGMPDPMSLTLRLAAAGKYQHDLVMEIGMTTQAYYLTVGTQSTVGAKLGGGVGMSLKQDFDLVSAGMRMADLTATGSYENQWQNGLLARVPRDKTTEATNQREFEDMLRSAVLWQEKGHAGPVDAILSTVDAASLNLLGQYNRESKRGELAGNVLSPQLAISRPVPGQPQEAAPPTAGTAAAPGPSAVPDDTAQVAQARGAWLQGRSQGEVRQTVAEEASGHYRYQEVKAGVRTLRQTGAAASLSVRLKDLGDGRTVNAGDVAGASRSADRVGGVEVTKRLVTMDGVTAPMRSRRVSEFLDLPRFEQAAEGDRARWINHGNTYTKFPSDFKPAPEDFRLRQQASEADFKQFFQDAAVLDNQFKQYLVVDCLQVPAAAAVDGYDASIALARKLGQHEDAAAMHAEREAFLADESTWQPRRLVINNVFNTANQPGVSLLGLEMRVSDNSEGAHNDVLFPRG
ncbi:hypothetical protein ACTJKJ_27050 [Roseateles sp. 22389]|uniref:hypothetical protein n=1 Tax=Roseateles sp. 22389 TaxID=3453916 RepID=UPI003F854CD0